MFPEPHTDQDLRPRRPQRVQVGQDRLRGFEGFFQRLPLGGIENRESTLEAADPHAVGDELGRDTDAGRLRKTRRNQADAGERVFEPRHLMSEKSGLQSAFKSQMGLQAARHGLLVSHDPPGFWRAQVGSFNEPVSVGVHTMLLKARAANDEVLVVVAEEIEGDIAFDGL